MARKKKDAAQDFVVAFLTLLHRERKEV